MNDWGVEPAIRVHILEEFEKEAKKFRGDPREIMFSFSSDVYQSDVLADFMGRVWDICEDNGLRVSVLTKAGIRAKQHFLSFALNKWKFGSTIIFRSEKLREEWEPGAPSIQSRIDALKMAFEMGIVTWVSVEPVIDPEEALAVMKELKPFVHIWKVGKLNHFEEETVDWRQFLRRTKAVLDGSTYFIKRDLAAFSEEPMTSVVFCCECGEMMAYAGLVTRAEWGCDASNAKLKDRWLCQKCGHESLFNP
jgi:hypothetical protein